MPSTILVIGATGNTGRSVVRNLPSLLEGQGHRIVGLTRSAQSTAAKELAGLPSVEMIEKDWTEIDAAWLQEHNVERVYLASHNGPSQFTDESNLLFALLQAKVRYVVRVSTFVGFIGPATPIFYGRTHWAIENLLSQPEFDALAWTSLRANFFAGNQLAGPANWIKTVRATGKTGPLLITLDQDAAMAMMDPADVGTIGAHLLALGEAGRSKHASQRYLIAGPENVTGADLVALVEKIAGVKVPAEQITFRDRSWIDELVSSGAYPAKLVATFKVVREIIASGHGAIARAPTHPNLLELAPPKGTAEDVLRTMI